MILEIKQYLNGEYDGFHQKLEQISQTEEAYHIWKYQIFKLRKLTQQQVEKVYHLFEQFYINSTQIQSNEKLTEYLSLCRLCMNFTEGKYINWKNIYIKLLEQKNQFILDKLVILGECELLFNNCEDVSVMSPIYLKKFLKYVIFHKIEQWKKYESQIVHQTQLILKAALSAKVQQNSESILYEISKAGNNHKEMFDSIVMSWSNKNFIQNASLKTQLYCSNLIILFIKDGFNNDLIHDGIQKRLNTQTQIPRKCGMLVWKQFVKSLNIESNYQIEELEQDEIDEIWETKPEPKVTEQIIEPSNEFQDFENVEIVPETSLVKNLYDCILALRSEDQIRIDAALKHLPYLIRHGLDIHVHGDTLCDILILGRDWKSDQEILRIQCLVALSIMRPQIADRLIEKYFSEELSIMQRIYILKIIRESVIELSSNPKKYPLEKYDQFDQNQNSTFYFKQISTTYTSPSIPNKREPVSRRWGHTKRAHEGLQIVQPYVNRFHQLTDHFYFPLLVYSQTKHKLLLMREPLLMLNFLEVLLNMIDCGQNALHKAKLISEALDFLISFEKNKNVEIILMKLRVMLKIVILLKGEFDDRVAKILINLKYDDERVKQIYELIMQYI